MADILGLEVQPATGHFLSIKMSNAVTLDFYTRDGHHEAFAHYAFLVSDDEFDHGMDRLTALGVTYFPTPWMDPPGEINHNDGGRGVYFCDPTGNSTPHRSRVGRRDGRSSDGTPARAWR